MSARKAKLGDGLTPEEFSIIRSVSNGDRISEAAEKAGVSERHARYCVLTIYKKLGARSLAHAAAIFTSQRIHNEN